MADACQDGVRKKAKYLHDAPPEALRPVLGPNYNPTNNARNTGPLTGSTSASDTSPGGSFFPQLNPSPTSFSPMQYQSTRGSQMAPPLQETLPYNNQPSPMSSSFTAGSSQRPLSMQGLPTSSNIDMGSATAFNGPLSFDPSNPAFFNFDLEGLNFGNHYGALEFGMLNHMSSGAAETPPQDQHNGSISQSSDSVFNPGVFTNNLGQYAPIYTQPDARKDISIDRQNSTGNVFDLQRSHSTLPRAYAIETNNPSMASPSTDAQNSPQPSLGFDSSPTASQYPNPSINQGAHSRPVHRKDTKPTPKFNHQSLATPKRVRDPSSIYTKVTEPYPYTLGFHALTACIQKRFSASATLKIAKSLASIRPSFISCTKTLNREDLIFMEKCFQRTLFEYEEFMRDCSTPTLVCRRTGEVAAVNKEFTLLTGWQKDVLLGKETNLNVNTGRSASQPVSTANSMNNTGRAGQVTPRMRPLSLDKGDSKPHSVFLAELMDDDSVIEFYDDFAKLAFGDSRGSVTKRCKMLKYQPKEGNEDLKDEEGPKNDRKRKDKSNGTMLGGRVSKIDGEHGIGRLQVDGKLDCAYCWTVKRDVFDIPMLIVMNVSCYNENFGHPTKHLISSCLVFDAFKGIA